MIPSTSVGTGWASPPLPLPCSLRGCGVLEVRLLSADTLLAQRIEWLEALQRKRQDHLARLAALIATKQLEIDNLKARLAD